MFHEIQKGLGKKKKPVEPVPKDPNAQIIEEEKNGFETIGGKEISNEYLIELRLNGSIGVGGKGQAVRLTDQDDIRGQRAAEEYVFNIVASNKVSFSIKFIRKVIESKKNRILVIFLKSFMLILYNRSLFIVRYQIKETMLVILMISLTLKMEKM